MRPIDAALVNEVWADISRYPAAQVQAEAQTFLDQQPHVAAFASGLTRELDAPVQQAALGLCFLLFKVVERSLGRPFPLLAEERIEQALTADGPGHAGLVAHILSVFYGGPLEASGEDADVQATLFVILKTLIGALDIGAVAG